MVNRKLKAGIAVALLVLVLAILADFIAPYSIDDQDRDHFLAPPTRPHFVAEDGAWHSPFVYGSTLSDPTQMIYVEERSIRQPVRFFVEGERYRLFGVFPSTLHLFGVDAPGRIFLLGSDGLGRDVFSRLLVGTRLSLFIAVAALIISIPMALALGCLAGYFGGKTDFVCMRLIELFLALPALYLVIALRSALPLNIPAEHVALALVFVLSLFGWAGLARIVRGMVLSLRQRDYIVAAVAMGASDWRIVRRHLLPQLIGFILIQAAISAPGFMLAEVTLSYLGLGIQEPAASWGSMLSAAHNVEQMLSFWWNLAPAAAILVVSLTCQLLAEGLRQWSDPRQQELSSLRETF
ncbi:MAG: ABC transporter permease [Acidobacteriota bacterium]